MLKLNKSFKFYSTIKKSSKIISFSLPILNNLEEKILSSVILSGRLVMGPYVEKFEEQIAKFCGQKYAIAVTSGTSALTLSLTSMNINNNSIVFVPAYTWVATYNAPKLLGAEVRLVDIDSHNFCINPISSQNLFNKIQFNNKKSVIIPVHMFGNRCPSNLGNFDYILGDGCCAFGGKDIDGTRCGNWNEIECFSFHPRKLITTGEGGMVLCSNDKLASLLRIRRDHGAFRSPEQRFQTINGGDMIPDFPEAGYNMRLTELQGALGVSQMDRIDMIIDSRMKVAETYDQRLNYLYNNQNDYYLRLPIKQQPGAERVLTMYSVQLRSNKLDEYINKLSLLKINSDSDSNSNSNSNPNSNSTTLSILSNNSNENFVNEILNEIKRLKNIKSTLMTNLVNDGIVARPPMISLLDVDHIQRDHYHLTGENLIDDKIKLVSFPETFCASQLTFALPLHPLLSSDDIDHVTNRVRYHFQSNYISNIDNISLKSPHDFTIQYPIRREYFQTNYKLTSNQLFPSKELLNKLNSTKYSDTPTYKSLLQSNILPPPSELLSNRELLLYIHIPFCKSKCHYCNFAVDTRQSEELRDEYVRVLSKELEKYVNLILDPSRNIKLTGIDIGGGTPTLLSEKHLKQILTIIQPLRNHSKEIDPVFLSIETTPEIAATEPSKLQLLYDYGIHRISVGIQTSNNTLLSSVNRSNQENYITQAIQNLKNIGFKRISVDLIFGLPNQSFDQWKLDLQRVVELNPDSITTYDCIYKGKGRGLNTIKNSNYPSWKFYGEMYDYGYNYLIQNGYHAPYGSVNFSKRSNETGTSRYFENRLLRGINYIGIGNYASTLVDRYWIFSPHSIEGWLNDIESQSQTETQTESEFESSSNEIKSFQQPKWSTYNVYSLPIEERVAKYILSSISFGFIDENLFETAFPTWNISYFYKDILQDLIQRKWFSYDQEKRIYNLNQNCFQYLPQIRALFHTPKSLEWYDLNVIKKIKL